MATLTKSALPRVKPVAPDPFERVRAAGAVVLLISVLVALAKGHSQWALVPWQVWPHLLTIMVALAPTPAMLLRRRGDRFHRRLGWVWASAMFLTAVSSLDLSISNPGGWSFIHLLSLGTMIQVPIIVWSARTHNVKRHRRAVRGMVTGALLVAGFFTFPFNRLLGHWLFS